MVRRFKYIMYVLLRITVILMLFTGKLFAQDTLMIEVKDFRNNAGFFTDDTLKIPSSKPITPVYIAKVFGFFIPTKEWLTSQKGTDEKKETIRPTSLEKTYTNTVYDSLGRIVRHIYFSCFSCQEKSFERVYSYNNQGDIVTISELNAEEVISRKRGDNFKSEKPYERYITVIQYTDSGMILSIKLTYGHDILFSLRVLN